MRRVADGSQTVLIVDDDAYLNKPVDPDKLAREIRQLLARSTVELQRRRQVGLADARARDKLEAAFTPKDAR